MLRQWPLAYLGFAFEGLLRGCLRAGKLFLLKPDVTLSLCLEPSSDQVNRTMEGQPVRFLYVKRVYQPSHINGKREGS